MTSSSKITQVHKSRTKCPGRIWEANDTHNSAEYGREKGKLMTLHSLVNKMAKADMAKDTELMHTIVTVMLSKNALTINRILHI